MKTRIQILLSAGFLILIAVFSSRWTGLGTPYYNGDEASHCFNAIVLADFVRAGTVSFSDPMKWVSTYYVHFPSIAPMVWPPVLYFLMFPLVVIFGVDYGVMQAFIMLLWAFMGIGWMIVLRRHVGLFIAVLSAVIIMFVPLVFRMSHFVMLEVPAMFFVPWVIWAVHRFCETQKRWYSVLGAALFVMATLTKQHAVAVFPVAMFLLYPVIRRRSWLDWIPWGVAVGFLGLYYLGAAFVQHVNASDVFGGWDFFSHLRTIDTFFSLSHAGLLMPILTAVAMVGFRRIPRVISGMWLMVAANLAMVLFCANVDVRYLIFSYPPLIALGAAVIVSSPIYSAKWFRGLMIVMVFVTVLFTYFGTRIDRMRGADIVMDAALTTSQTRRLLVIGNNPHSLIFEARRSDPGLRSVVLRDSKLLYAANWFLDRDPEVFVHSGSEILDRLRLAGIDTVIVDLAGVPPIIAPAVSDALRMPGMVRVSDHIIQLGDQVSTVSIYYVEGVGTPSATISLPIKTSDRFSEIKADLSFHLL